MNPTSLINAFLATTGEKLESASGFGPIAKLIYRFVMDAVTRLMTVDSLAGTDKKQLVMSAVEYLFDHYFGTITLPWYLRWMFWLKDPADRKSFLENVDRVLEAFYAHAK